MKSLILMTGSTGAGKTTHARILAEKTGAHYISSGDIARGLMDEATSKEFHKGQLSPHEDEIRAEVLKQINEHETVVLDGFPRKIDQWEWLARAVAASFFVVRLDWSEKILVNRWTDRNRNEHDTLKAYALRHELYKAETEPLFRPDLTLGGGVEKSVMEINSIIRQSVGKWLGQTQPELELKDSRTNQLIDEFIADHHFSRWMKGQATTYVTLDEDVEKRLWEIVESAR